MKTTKTNTGTYKVELNGYTFEIENMKEFCQDWTIKENDFNGEWLMSCENKKTCIEWIKTNY